MTSLNPLKTFVLVTPDEVLFHAPTDNEVDIRHIESAIIIAERRFIKPMLGLGVYTALTVAKNKTVTSGNLAALQIEVNSSRGTRKAITLQVGDIVNSASYLSINDQTLWRDYLHKIVSECVYFVALPHNRARFNAQGVEINNPADITGQNGKSAGVELRDLKHLMDVTLQQRIMPLMEDLHQYMCAVKYTGYTKPCDCSSDGTAYSKRSSIMLSMYDDIDNCKCDWDKL